MGHETGVDESLQSGKDSKILIVAPEQLFGHAWRALQRGKERLRLG
jgi:hypothetical protein